MALRARLEAVTSTLSFRLFAVLSLAILLLFAAPLYLRLKGDRWLRPPFLGLVLIPLLEVFPLERPQVVVVEGQRQTLDLVGHACIHLRGADEPDDRPDHRDPGVHIDRTRPVRNRFLDNRKGLAFFYSQGA